MRLLVNGIVGLAVLAFVEPAFAKDEAAAATVVCKDGSTSKAGRGACRGHGGVDKAAGKAAGGAAAPAAEPRGKRATEPAERGEAKGAKKVEEKADETTVTCKDGSTSKGGRGACRGHGGVDRTASAKGAGAAAVPPAAPRAAPAAPVASPAAPPARAAAPAPAAGPSAGSATPNAKNTDPAGAIAKCKDGTYSHAKGHSGACSRHGGVAEWLDGTEKK